MNEIKLIAPLVGNLNELETAELLEQLCEHIIKNKWEHLLKQIDYVDDLQNEIEELKGAKADIIAKVEMAIADMDKAQKYLIKI